MPLRRTERKPAGLRIRLGLLIAVITGLCVFGVIEYRNARLAGTHQQIARAQLLAMARGFSADFGPAALSDPSALAGRLRGLARSQPGLERASIYRSGGGGVPALVASTASPPRAGRSTLRPLGSGRTQYAEEGSGDRRSGELLFPLRMSDRPVAVLELDMSLTTLDAALERERAIGIVIAFATALLTALLAGTVIDRMVAAPIREVRLAAHRIARGRYDTRLRFTRPDEIGDLARAFDSMAGHLHDARAELKSLASVDPLTAVSNRRAFRGALRGELRRAGRERYSVSLVALDIDRFKEINDEHGHAVGDEALVAVAHAIRAECRPSDVCGRLGGDEFVVALPQTGHDEAIGVVERLRKRVASIPIGPDAQRVTLSIGVAEFPTHAVDEDDLTRMADLALYRAKEKGRNRCEVYSARPTPPVRVTPPDPVTIGGRES